MNTGDFAPAYRKLLESGGLIERVRTAYEHLRACDLCARGCGVDRTRELGYCKTGEHAIVSSYFPHMGEEDPLRGTRGSGTIFFARCNLACQFCQNYDISQRGAGVPAAPEDIAVMMLELQERGCHNINFVSPSHVVAQILAATLIAAQAGLSIPLVYNTGGYDSMVALKLLDGVIDLYMPDMKYADAEIAQKYSKAPNYPAVNFAAVREMHRQVGDLVLDRRGVALRGLLVRHLVMPEDLAGTAEVMRFLAEEISRDTYVNVMDQYRPAWRVTGPDAAPLNRAVRPDEVTAARQMALDAGLHRLDERRPLWRIMGF
ncbi:MAG: radical SAM protein [Anaerolineae bacterium]|nr:radical SAM protein [Anaerolineae bacterium]